MGPWDQSRSVCTCKALLPVLHPCACLGVPVPLDVVGDVYADGEFVRVWIPATRARSLKSPAGCDLSTSVFLLLAVLCIVDAGRLYWQMRDSGASVPAPADSKASPGSHLGLSAVFSSNPAA